MWLLAISKWNQSGQWVNAEGRLASQARFKRHISHCPHTLFTPKISQIPMAEPNMGIQSPPIWSKQCSIHILKLMKPVVSTMRRLGIRSSFYLDDMLIMARSNGATGGSRVYNQPEEEHPHTNTGVRISWFPAEFPQHDHWATNSQASHPEEDGGTNGRPEEENTAGASLPSRDDGSGSSGNPTSFSPLQTSRECQVKSTLEWLYIQGRFGYRSQHEVRSGMVAKRLQPAQWETLADRAVGSDNRIRCIQKGLGSQLPRSKYWRPLVRSGKDPSHQFSRTTGCLSGSEVICLQPESNLDFLVFTMVQQSLS